MRIRYVVSSMVFWWRENNLSFEQECEYLNSLGFGIELMPSIKGQDECRYNKRNWPRLAAATQDMLVSMRSRTDCPNLEQWKEQIECAKLLGAEIITDLKSFGIQENAEVNGCDFSAEIVKCAEENNVKLCIETGSLTHLKTLGEKFDSIWYCFDTGHVNLDTKFSFNQYVDELADRIIHLHLTDNYGQIDDHAPPGLKGGISRENWDYLLAALEKHDNDIIGSFEMSPLMPAVMIRKASEFMFDKLDWPGRPQKNSDHLSVAYNPV